MADELSSWLRRVRPHVPADDGWADTADGDEALSAIHARATRAMVTQRRNRRWAFVPGAVVAASAVAVLVATLASTPTTLSHSRTTVPVAPPARPAAQLLEPFTSCDTLLSSLHSHAVAHVSAFENQGVWFGKDAREGYLTPAGATVPSTYSNLDHVAAGEGAAASGTSTTNVQEAGVDEPDIVKTDGDRVLVVSGGALHVIDAASRKAVSKLDLSLYSGAENAQLLASGDRAVVLLQSYGYSGGPVLGGPVVSGPARPVPNGGGQQTVHSTVLYVSLSGTPSVTGTLQVDGTIVDARMVGSTVRVVATSAPRIVLPTPTGDSKSYNAAVKKALGKAALSDWLPQYTVATPTGNQTRTVPCTAVSHPSDFTAASMLSVYTIDAGQPGADPEPVTLTADGNTVYASQTSLYVASNPQCPWCYGTSAGGTTEIHRFDITGTSKPTYLGSGSVQGSLLSQYSLSEDAGFLRVATTETSRSSESNSVDVLDAATLKQVGTVGGLGKGERIYAVRFLGSLAYVVTFRQTDPLYIVDLSNPRAPRVAGSLQLNGFSSYLHDVGGGRLLGVGQDVSNARVAGLMVQLFDVSNPNKPTRTAHVVLPGAPGESQFDPHSFLYWQPTGLVVVPVSTWNSADMGKALAVRVHGQGLSNLGTVANRADRYGAGIQRSLIVDNALWTFSAAGIRVSDQSTLAEAAWIPLV